MVRAREGALTPVRAHDSFLTVAVAALTHRVILAGQYAMGACALAWLTIAGFLGHRAGRRTHGIRWQVGSHVVTAVVVAIAIAIPANSQVMALSKIGILFGAMLLNIVVGLAVDLVGWIDTTNGPIIADRYATLTLMIT